MVDPRPIGPAPVAGRPRGRRSRVVVAIAYEHVTEVLAANAVRSGPAGYVRQSDALVDAFAPWWYQRADWAAYRRDPGWRGLARSRDDPLAWSERPPAPLAFELDRIREALADGELGRAFDSLDAAAQVTAAHVTARRR
jgi:hypothetical protein